MSFSSKSEYDAIADLATKLPIFSHHAFFLFTPHFLEKICFVGFKMTITYISQNLKINVNLFILL